MQKLAKLALAGVLGLSAGCYATNVEFHQNDAVSLEKKLEFTRQEKSIISDALKQIEKKYALPLDIVFIKSDAFEGQTAGGTYPRLGHDQELKDDFIKLFGQKMYGKLEGKNVIALREFEYTKEYEGKYEMWSSIYLHSPKAKELYERALIHEVFHIYFDNVSTTEIINQVNKIDHDNRLNFIEGKNHPCHPSYYTYMTVVPSDSFKDGVPTAGEHDARLRRICANETFADTMALYTMGLVDEEVKDKEFVKKLELFKQAMWRYRK